LLESCCVERRAGDPDDIPPGFNQIPVLAHDLTHAAAGSIASDCIPDAPAGDKAASALHQGAGQDTQDQQGMCVAGAGLTHLPESFSIG
jgi:hypothetical protein